MAKFTKALFVEYELLSGSLHEFHNFHRATVANYEESIKSNFKTIKEQCNREQALKSKVEQLDSFVML